MEEIKKRYIFSSLEHQLPLFIESIGYNPQEEDFARPEGYPYFHWLQTIDGEGVFTVSGKEYVLTTGQGLFLTPFTPHSYYTTGEKWTTIYVTFGGSIAEAILNSLELNYSALYSETEELKFSDLIMKMMDKIEKDSEFSRLDSSEYLYRLLIMLKKRGRLNNQHSLSHYYEKIRPIVEWLENNYAQNIGLRDMEEQANVSSQYLTLLFRQTFKMSPYSFLIQLRVREAKKKLVAHHDLPLKKIAELVGFNDVSHFIATFRKLEGITPKKYRLLFSKT